MCESNFHSTPNFANRFSRRVHEGTQPVARIPYAPLGLHVELDDAGEDRRIHIIIMPLSAVVAVLRIKLRSYIPTFVNSHACHTNA